MKKTYIKCPFCANEIKEWTIKCPHCEEFLDWRNHRKENKLGIKPSNLKIIVWIIIWILLILCLLCWLFKDYNKNDISYENRVEIIQDSNSTLDDRDTECKEIWKSAIRTRLYELYGFQSGMGVEDEIITDEDHTISNIDYFYSKKTDECLYSYILTNHHDGHIFLEIEEMSYGESLYDKLVESDDDYIEWRNIISNYKNW